LVLDQWSLLDFAFSPLISDDRVIKASTKGPNGTRQRNYLLGLGSSYFLTFASVFVGFFLTPFSLRFLDREQFAIFTLTADILAWMLLLDFGIAAGLKVQAAQMAGRW